MKIPKSVYETIFLIAITAIVVFSSIMAVFNLFNRIAMIVSGIWFILITTILWIVCKNEGGLRRYLVNYLGELAGRKFVETTPQGEQPPEVYFGYRLFGHRFLQFTIAIDKIESVEWDTGQATDMSGRDMNDWSVCLWFDHDDPAKSAKNSCCRKPDQDIRIVGPARRKEVTEAFGLLFVDFLRAAGAALVQGDKSSCFVRRKS